MVATPNFKTFDSFDGHTPTSIKSIDVTMPSYTTRPASIKNTLNGYIDKTLDFTRYTNKDITLQASQIQTKNVSLAVMGKASPAQLAALNSSMQYAA